MPAPTRRSPRRSRRGAAQGGRVRVARVPGPPVSPRLRGPPRTVPARCSSPSCSATSASSRSELRSPRPGTGCEVFRAHSEPSSRTRGGSATRERVRRPRFARRRRPCSPRRRARVASGLPPRVPVEGVGRRRPDRRRGWMADAAYRRSDYRHDREKNESWSGLAAGDLYARRPSGTLGPRSEARCRSASTSANNTEPRTTARTNLAFTDCPFDSIAEQPGDACCSSRVGRCYLLLCRSGSSKLVASRNPGGTPALCRQPVDRRRGRARAPDLDLDDLPTCG